MITKRAKADHDFNHLIQFRFYWFSINQARYEFQWNNEIPVSVYEISS